MRAIASVALSLWLLVASVLFGGCERPVEPEVESSPTPRAEKLKRKKKPVTTPAPEEPAPASAPVPTTHPVEQVSAGSSSGELVKMSWYTMGTRTASGEPVQPGAHNCAGASRWTLGDSVAIRNPENGRGVTVRINDRGGFESMGRALDCMPAVWRTLGFDLDRGVVTVQLVA